VKFNDFTNAAAGMLAKETLYELPGQMLSYFQDNKIVPQEKANIAKMHLKPDGEQAAAAASASASDNTVPLTGDVEPFVRGKSLRQDPSLMNVTVPKDAQGGQEVIVDTPGGIELAIKVGGVEAPPQGGKALLSFRLYSEALLLKGDWQIPVTVNF
jgi:hypothetical protein